MSKGQTNTDTCGGLKPVSGYARSAAFRRLGGTGRGRKRGPGKLGRGSRLRHPARAASDPAFSGGKRVRSRLFAKKPEKFGQLLCRKWQRLIMLFAPRTRRSPGSGEETAMAEKLTVLIPCKNERQHIEGCIESVRPVADEILVADSGSVDGTLEVVRRMGGCRIIQREYIYSADFKNWAIPQAKYPWVMVVDADERLTGRVIASIRRVLADPSPELDAYWVSFECFFLGHRLRHSGWNTDAIRLFRRDVCRYEDRLVHAEIDVDRQRVGKLEGKILHYSISSYEQFLEKYGRYTTWGARTLWGKGRRATFTSLCVRPMLRFCHLYVLRGGFLDGLAGLQICMLMAFFNTFVKQAKLWELGQRDQDGTRGRDGQSHDTDAHGGTADAAAGQSDSAASHPKVRRLAA
ncbi:MAG TPA: glycosyltransferase family 2 protein [Planctomycetes bacterium]|nr:glycosyltransferase family 2 protein [Planctomycetota bacterium]